MDRILSILTPLLPLVSFFLGYYFNRLIEKSKNDKELNKRYLNGLRLYLEETYYRLFQINQIVLQDGNCPSLTLINSFREIKIHISGNDLFAKKQCKSFEEALDTSIDALKTQIKKLKKKSKGVTPLSLIPEIDETEE